MGLLLATAFRSEISKFKDKNIKAEALPDVAYPTGFLSFDCMNGYIAHAIDDKGEDISYNNFGINNGSLAMVIGRSGCGKTTWLIQSAANIVRKYKTSCIYHDDIEGGVVRERIKMLTRFTEEQMQNNYIRRDTGITAENFYERLCVIKGIKQANDEYLYDTGRYDTVGNKIFKYEPTVYILDSLAVLMPEKYADEESLSGNMAATAAARVNTGMIKRIIPMLKSCNIILMLVNHITDAVATNQFDVKKAQLAYLKVGESLPGGKAVTYLANLLLRFDDYSKLKLDSSSNPYNVKGILVRVSILKSRSASADSFVTLVFIPEEGFDYDLSLLQMMDDEKKLNGSGHGYYFNDDSDHKFKKKTFREDLAASPELRKSFSEACSEVLLDYLNRDIFEGTQSYDNTDSILDLIS